MADIKNVKTVKGSGGPPFNERSLLTKKGSIDGASPARKGDKERVQKSSG